MFLGTGELRHPKKIILFPVQRVAVIVASQAAAIFFLTFLFFVGKYCPFFFLGGGGGGNAKMQKKNSRPFFGHPAAPLETESFFSLALWLIRECVLLMIEV